MSLYRCLFNVFINISAECLQNKESILIKISLFSEVVKIADGERY
ncbi:hypothetical protein HMPREF9540_02123 [Escherichia coli MS 115-1]|nr:hypothetical protein HMPREF9540_02123 [Escherichia coli MS 115-1]